MAAKLIEQDRTKAMSYEAPYLSLIREVNKCISRIELNPHSRLIRQIK